MDLGAVTGLGHRRGAPAKAAAMTPEIALAIALKCRDLPRILAPIAVGIALHENPPLDPLAVNYNTNGTVDRGLTQINSSNDGWLSRALSTPVNAHTITDPCLNFRAAIAVLFVRYNGAPPEAVKVAYAQAAITSISHVPDNPVVGTPSSPSPPCAPSWDAWATAACSKPQPLIVTAQEKTHAN
jgi:hypothetical protein